MKLLFIVPEYLPHAGGGISTYYRMLLPQLVALGHEVKVIVGSGVFAETAAPSINIDGVGIDVLKASLLDKQHARLGRVAAMPGLRRHLAAAWALREQAGNGEGYDVAEATDWGLLFMPWALEPGPPVVVQMHGSCGQIAMHDPVKGEELQGELIRLLEMQVLARADRVQSYSYANAAFWRAQASCRVDLLRPAWQPLAEQSHSPRRSERGLVVGRVQRWKGPQVLCAALRALGDRAPVIDWVGRDTAYKDRNTTTSAYLAETYPDVWNRRLIHRSQKPPEETARLQAKASFVVVPSTWDMFNFTCVEAMAAGTPVICSTGAGASELVDDGVNGFVFANADAAALARALERCMSLSTSERQAIGIAAQRTVRTELCPEAIASLRAQEYQDVSASARTSSFGDDWLRRACSPIDGNEEELAFLDHLPLKPLARYIARRSVSRLGK